MGGQCNKLFTNYEVKKQEEDDTELKWMEKSCQNSRYNVLELKEEEEAVEV